MISKRLWIKALLISVLSVMTLLAVGCSGDDGSVRIGFFPNITHAQALIGRATGGFEEALGAPVSWISFNAGPSELEAMVGGAVDIGYIGPVPAVNGNVRTEGSVVIIAGAANGGCALITREGVELKKDIARLDGLNVAVPQYGNTQDLLLRSLLEGVGLRDEAKGGTVRIVQSENSSTRMLLERGELDAALVPEPWASRLLSEAPTALALDWNELYDGGYATTVVMVSEKFLKKSPELVESFVAEHIRLTELINSDKEAAADIINGQLKELTGSALEREVLLEAFERVSVCYELPTESLMQYAQSYKRLGFIDQLPEAESLIEASFIESIEKRGE